MADPMELSATERQILNTITSHVDEYGWPPTVQELCDAVGVTSKSTMHHHLTVLEAHGWLRRKAGSPRALAVVDDDEQEDDDA